MLVDPKPQIAKVDAPPHRRDGESDASRRPAPRSVTVLALVLVAAALGAGAHAQLSGPRLHPEAPAAVAERVQPLIRSKNQVTVPERSPVRAKLAIEAVTEQDIDRTLILPAMVEADPAHLVKVLPPLAGRVIKLDVQLGERVTAGQPLVVIDSPDLAAAYADYDRGKVLLALALKTRDRQRGLAKVGGAAEKDLQQSETDYVTAEAEFRRAEARLKQIGVDAETTSQSRTVTVVAPMSGSVTDLGVAAGAYWNDPTAALMTIADLATVWVTASVPEKDISLVAQGQEADVALPAYPNEVFKGRVLFVSDVLDADTRRTRVRIAFANPGIRLRPGMFANVSFHAPARQVPVVPASALVLKDDANQVFVETAPWTFEARSVDVGFQEGERVVLTGGVKPGDRVVVKGGVLLGD
jgi:cobalt-zinc-cadmium efflux system membrane fusion protein